MLRIPKLSCLVITAVLCSMLNTKAQATTPLCAAAAEYQSAVKHFEIAIYERRFDSYTKRMVQRLEDASIEMRAASHQLHRLDRLAHAWDDIQHLHPRVESIAFRPRSTCLTTRDLGLEQCWERVNCAYRDLAKEVRCVLGQHPAGVGAPEGVGIPQLDPRAYGTTAIPSSRLVPESPFATDPRFIPDSRFAPDPRYSPSSHSNAFGSLPPGYSARQTIPAPASSRLVPSRTASQAELELRLRPDYRRAEVPVSTRQARAAAIGALLQRILD
ncbi:MAG: hypothetical protein AAF483_15285 [Planctomycetota bacterium]